ncbi:hypothetical protein C6500_12675 [Candidatus Poribacteria bacterium]|nr:MAG: hypothetical protein C6500_12675 [Candidatus Poribacteria bacterium]
MKTFLKRLTFLIIFIIAIGAGICVYLLQAPPVEQKKVPKLQIHTRTALRGRPTTDSKPIVYTKDVYRFSLDRQYISNLNSGKLERELLFRAGLAHRARLKTERLDASLKTGTDWQKMFSDMTKDIRFRPSTSPIEVLLSGEEWLLRDTTGAAYTVVKADSNVEVYLPDLREAFEAHKISLSKDLEISIKQTNRRWLITDKGYQQAYSIVKGEGKLNVFQQSKYEILTFLFEADAASQRSLTQGKLPSKLIQEFVAEKIPLSRRARVSANQDGMSWQITSLPMKYNIRNENNRLKVYLDLESRWLRIKADDTTKGWVQSERGTIFEPPPPIPSSRQQAKERLLVLIDRLKEKVGLFDG